MYIRQSSFLILVIFILCVTLIALFYFSNYIQVLIIIHQSFTSSVLNYVVCFVVLFMFQCFFFLIPGPSVFFRASWLQPVCPLGSIVYDGTFLCNRILCICRELDKWMFLFLLIHLHCPHIYIIIKIACNNTCTGCF